MENDVQNNDRKDCDQCVKQFEADCHFLVGGSSNQRVFDGNRMLLAMKSIIFERMFYGSLPENSDLIIITDVQPNAFKAMLKYIYTGEISIPSFEIACELYYLAMKYMLQNVVEYCSNFLLDHLSPNTACFAYECGKLFDDKRLIESSMKYIVNNTLEVIRDSSFMDIEFSTLMDILGQNRLNIEKEMDLFNCLLQFANEYGILNEVGSKNASDFVVEDSTSAGTCGSVTNVADEVVVVDSDASASGNEGESEAANLITMNESDLRQAVKKIRFLTMTSEEFAEGPARSKLLQQNEAFAILLKIIAPENNDFLMPEGFSQSSDRYYDGNDDDIEGYFVGARLSHNNFSCLNPCQLSFKVDKKIYLLSVRIKFVRPDNSKSFDDISVYILDHLGAEIARTSSVQDNNRSMFEFIFDSPVTIECNQYYYFKIRQSPVSDFIIALSRWEPEIVSSDVTFSILAKNKHQRIFDLWSAINRIVFLPEQDFIPNYIKCNKLFESILYMQ